MCAIHGKENRCNAGCEWVSARNKKRDNYRRWSANALKAKWERGKHKSARHNAFFVAHITARNYDTATATQPTHAARWRVKFKIEIAKFAWKALAWHGWRSRTQTRRFAFTHGRERKKNLISRKCMCGSQWVRCLLCSSSSSSYISPHLQPRK